MSSHVRILGIAGSLRRGSYNEAALRAAKLLPIRKDAVNGPLMIEHLAITYTWCGEKDRALEQLAIAISIPSTVNYGKLRLYPYWDPLRGDSRFEKIVASLAPK